MSWRIESEAARAREDWQLRQIVARASVESSPVTIRQMSDEEMAAAGVVRPTVADIRAGLAEALGIREIAARWGTADLLRVAGMIRKYRLIETYPHIKAEIQEIYDESRESRKRRAREEELDLKKAAWTVEEDEIIRRHYGEEGYHVGRRLRGRTPDAIYERARQLGVRREKPSTSNGTETEASEPGAATTDSAAPPAQREIALGIVIRGELTALERALLGEMARSWVAEILRDRLAPYGLSLTGMTVEVSGR